MRPNMQLRAILWLYLASELFVSLLTTCVVVHVLLTIATVCTKLAHRVQKWYDVGALSVALIATHPVLYVGRLVEWDKELHTMRVDGMLWVRKWHMWVVFLVWISVCILANVCLVSVVACKMLKYDGLVSKQAAVYSNPLDGHLDAICQIRKARRRVQFVALRLSCYALVPIFTHVWTLACAMSTASWLLNWAPIMASTQGIIFLFLLAINPACDELWLTFHTRMSKQECTKHETLRLDFAQLDASTIHLSPYQSRSSMTV
ncbi:hypothetical protein IW145_003525 [Coemansia sp. RSA 521]|nr:hypothetical protein IW145_003525 [Coemansia sp. RSA 521]KAJ2276041.1 hypothetical protein GGH14_003658 [Coemansia sp. RSA 370]KAJ2433560.1 hypothetical protein IWW41_001994 [Coemansia sp. RSA 2522]